MLQETEQKPMGGAHRRITSAQCPLLASRQQGESVPCAQHTEDPSGSDLLFLQLLKHVLENKNTIFKCGKIGSYEIFPVTVKELILIAGHTAALQIPA